MKMATSSASVAGFACSELRFSSKSHSLLLTLTEMRQPTYSYTHEEAALASARDSILAEAAGHRVEDQAPCNRRKVRCTAKA